MRTIRVPLLLTVMLIAVFGFSTAFADASNTPPTTTPDTMATLWLLIGMSASTLWGAVGRYLTGRFNFFHNPIGQTIISLVGAVVGAVAPVVEGGWNKTAVIAAALGAVVAFVGGANSGQAGQNAAARAAGATVGPGPTITKAGVLIPLAFSLALLIGCATPGGRALQKCELNQLPQIEQTAIADVTQIATTGGANWQSQLENVGLSLAPGQLSCIVQAIVAAWTGKGAELTTERKAAVERLQVYLNAHPATACVPIWIPWGCDPISHRFMSALGPPRGDGPRSGALSALL